MSDLDYLTCKHTASTSFAQLCGYCAGGYVPTIHRARAESTEQELQILIRGLESRGYQVWRG